jgi:hypothetical protein
MHRRNRTVPRTAAIAAVLASLAPVPVLADESPLVAVSTRAEYRVAPEHGATFGSACPPPRCAGGRQARQLEFAAPSGLAAGLVECQTDTLPGQRQRARYGIGVRSQLLESALQGVGIEARHCLAPVVRMRTRRSASSDVAVTAWVYLRCTFE